jgi:2-(1,2-epoxy-1,2-dihydrophenyl)acetyl-CoA isomerase
MVEGLQVARTEDGIARIILSRPDKMNAITSAMAIGITDELARLDSDPDTRVIVLAGEGKHFSAGGDMGDISDTVDPNPQVRAKKAAEAVRTLSLPLALALEDVSKPIVAGVRGHVIGVALQLVLMADLVVASRTARFSLPQLRLGHTPDHGESWSLSRKVGLSRALQMCLMAERIDGETAERFGLANWVVEDDALESRLDDVAQRLADNPPFATACAKRLFHDGVQRTLTQAMDNEIETMERVAAQEDFAEAISAFAQRRAPVFKGR